MTTDKSKINYIVIVDETIKNLFQNAKTSAVIVTDEGGISCSTVIQGPVYLEIDAICSSNQGGFWLPLKIPHRYVLCILDVGAVENEISNLGFV